MHPAALERILQGERVDHGGEHADVVTGGADHPRLGEARASEDVAAADDDPELNTGSDEAPHLLRNRLEHPGVDAVAYLSEQRLAAQLHQDAIVGHAFFPTGAVTSEAGMRSWVKRSS